MACISELIGVALAQHVVGGTTVAYPESFRLLEPAVCGSQPPVTLFSELDLETRGFVSVCFPVCLLRIMLLYSVRFVFASTVTPCHFGYLDRSCYLLLLFFVC